jgi:hypothetical protein
MLNYQLVKLIINAKDRKQIIYLLNKYRIPVNKSKYCWHKILWI